MFYRYLIYLSVIYSCLLQYSIIYNRTLCNDTIAMAMLCCWSGAVCARCAAPRCELCGGRAAHPDPLPPAHPGPGPSQPAAPHPAPPPETPVRLRLVAAGRRQRRGGVRPDPRQWRHMVTSQLLYTALLQTSQRTVAILSTVNNLIKLTKIINVLISDCEGRMFLE